MIRISVTVLLLAMCNQACYSAAGNDACETRELDDFGGALLDIDDEVFRDWRRSNGKTELSCAAFLEHEKRRERQWKMLKGMIVISGSAFAVALLGTMSTDGGMEPIIPFEVILGSGIVAGVNAGVWMTLYARIGRTISDPEKQLKDDFGAIESDSDFRSEVKLGRAELGISMTF